MAALTLEEFVVVVDDDVDGTAIAAAAGARAVDDGNEVVV
jgi:hypothetical protein